MILLINCASSVEKAEAVAEECRAMGVQAVAMQWDVSDHAACEQRLQKLKRKWACRIFWSIMLALPVTV